MNNKSMLRMTAEDQGWKQFRTAYILRPGFRFDALKPHFENFVYCTDGLTDSVDRVRSQLEESLSTFDPNRDVLIPVGSIVMCMLSGVIVQRRMQELSSEDFIVGVFQGAEYDENKRILREGYYTFHRMYTDPTREAEEIPV